MDAEVAYRKKRKRTRQENESQKPPPNEIKSDVNDQAGGRRARSRDFDADDINTTERRRVKRVPRSVSEEVLALEGKFSTDNNVSIRNTQRGIKKRKKPRQQPIPGSGDDDNYEGDVDGEISEIFQVKDEDFLQQDAIKSNGSKSHAVIEPAMLPSQPLDFLFIEKKDGQGFIKEHKSKVLHHRQNDHMTSNYPIDFMQDGVDDTAMDFMLKFHRMFRSVSLIAHGLLAGMAISQCIFVYVLDSSHANLLQNYYKLAAPFQSLYYMLLAFCSISVLDRYLNVGSSWSQLLYRLLTKPSRAIASAAYLLALIFSVSVAILDDRISLYNDLPHLWNSTDKINTWKILNLVRVVGAVLGWIMVAITPNDDVTEKNIMEAIENEQNTDYEMKSPRNGNWRAQSDS